MSRKHRRRKKKKNRNRNKEIAMTAPKEMGLLDAVLSLAGKYTDVKPSEIPVDLDFLRARALASPPKKSKQGQLALPSTEDVKKYGKTTMNVSTHKGQDSNPYDHYSWEKELPVHQTYKGGKTSYGSSTFKHCDHYGITAAFQIDDKFFYGGTGSCIRNHPETRKSALIIDCGNVINHSDLKGGFVKDGPEEFLKLNALLTPPPIVKLDWPDGTAPSHLGLDFWQSFYKLLPAGKILACCIGGHGRTGTCLAALMIAALGCSGAEAIETVRKLHCKKAVETDSQEKYLKALGEQAAEQALNATAAKAATEVK